MHLHSSKLKNVLSQSIQQPGWDWGPTVRKTQEQASCAQEEAAEPEGGHHAAWENPPSPTGLQ